VYPAIEMSKEEIITAIQKCAEELGRQPSFQELSRVVTVSQRRMIALFGRYADALRAAGFEPYGCGTQAKMEELFADWAGIVRKTGGIPTIREYQEQSRYSVRPLTSRFGGWAAVPKGMLEFAKNTSAAGEWEDVVNVIRQHLEARKSALKTSTPGSLRTFAPRIMEGRPHYGKPILLPGMAHAPINEMGVVLLFGMLARQLGFTVLRAQAEFPDCEAMRQMEENRWQRVRIEFELKSHSFLDHGHDAKHCDLIVCWEHNWPACPIEVLELKGLVEEGKIG